MSRAKPASGEASPGVAESLAASLPHPPTATSPSTAISNANERLIPTSLDRLADATAARDTELRRLRTLLVEGDELREPRVIDRVEPQLHAPRRGDHRLGQTGIWRDEHVGLTPRECPQHPHLLCRQVRSVGQPHCAVLE